MNLLLSREPEMPESKISISSGTLNKEGREEENEMCNFETPLFY